MSIHALWGIPALAQKKKVTESRSCRGLVVSCHHLDRMRR